MKGYVNAKAARELFNVSNSTLRKWDKEGKIDAIRTPTNRRLYSTKYFDDYKINVDDSNKKQKICYCRVSSIHQKDDLKRQIEYMHAKYPDHTIIQDIGSGINLKRSGFKTILELAMQKKLSEVVVAYRDRLCRFAFELIQWVFETNGVQLLVLNEAVHSSEQELSEDLLSIIHVFSCKKMGQRRYQKKDNGL